MDCDYGHQEIIKDKDAKLEEAIKYLKIAKLFDDCDYHCDNFTHTKSCKKRTELVKIIDIFLNKENK